MTRSYFDSLGQHSPRSTGGGSAECISGFAFVPRDACVSLTLVWWFLWGIFSENWKLWQKEAKMEGRGLAPPGQKIFRTFYLEGRGVVRLLQSFGFQVVAKRVISLDSWFLSNKAILEKLKSTKNLGNYNINIKTEKPCEDKEDDRELE